MKIYNFNNIRRLKSKNEISTVFKSINFVKGFYYLIKYIPNNFNFDRMGIVIKKKFFNAVRRNYEKRILREFFRSKNGFNNFFDILVIVREVNGDFLDKKKEFDYLVSLIHKNDNK